MIQFKNPQEQMIHACILMLQNSLNCDAQEAFIILLDWIAISLGLTDIDIPVTISVPINAHNAISRLFKIETYCLSTWDWLGEVAQTLGVIPVQPSRGELGSVAFTNEENLCNDKSFQVLLDTNVGCGRSFIVDYHSKSTVIYTGAESDLTSYRIALINMGIFKIPSVITYNKKELKWDKLNWNNANLWTPEIPKLQYKEAKLHEGT